MTPTKRKLLLVLVALLVVVVVAGWWVANSTDTKGSRDAQGQAEFVRGSLAPTASPEVVGKIDLEPRQIPKQALGAKFAAATKYAVFVEQRASAPDLGSYFFAQRSIEYCSLAAMANDMASKYPKDHRAERVKALDGLLRKCEGLLTAQGLTIKPDEVGKEGYEARDVLISKAGMSPASALAVTKSRPDDPTALVDIALKSNDAYLRDAALEYLSVPGMYASLSVFGVRLDSLPPTEAAAVVTAMRLVRCDAGADCGRDSPELAFACIVDDRCGANSLEDLYRAGYVKAGRETVRDWQQVQRYRSQINEAIRSGSAWLKID